MGQSGSGKTTLLRALSLTEPADAGVVELDGKRYEGEDVERWPASPWPTVTVVFQDLFLWPHLTNQQNVELPVRERGLSARLCALGPIYAELEIEGLLGRFPTEVSRGQRQLVALARAVALQPRYLLLDEVSASLDVERASKVGALLRRTAASGVGVLVATHQSLFARNACDQLAYLSDGLIVEAGTPSILDNPKSEALQRYVASAAQAI